MLEFKISGDFKYDMGIFALKKILDYYKISHHYDDISLTIPSLPGKGDILERLYSLIILSVVDYDPEEIKNLMSNYDNIEDLFENLKNKEEIKKKIPAIFSKTHLNLFNFVFKNIIKDTFTKLTRPKNIKDGQCYYCGNDKEILDADRSIFFLNPSKDGYNKNYKQHPDIYICNRCAVMNIAITFLFKKTSDIKFIYVPNLEEIILLNGSDFSKQIILKGEKDPDFWNSFLFISFVSQKKNINYKIYQANNKHLNTREIRQIFLDIMEKGSCKVKNKKDNSYFDFKDDIVGGILENQYLMPIITKIIHLMITNSDFNPSRCIRNAVEYEILKEDGMQEFLNGLKGFAYALSKRIEKEGLDTNRKKRVALDILNASKVNLEYFMNTLARVMVRYEIPLSQSVLNNINEKNYTKAGTFIAMQLLSTAFKEKENNQKEEEHEDNGNSSD